MYQAIVFLPLLGAILAGIIALAGAHARHPGGPPAEGDHGHGLAAGVHGLAAGVHGSDFNRIEQILALGVEEHESLFGFLVFLAGLRRLIRQVRPDYEWIAALVFGSGLVVIAVELVGDGLEAGAALDTWVKTDPTVVRALMEGSFPMFGALGLILSALMLASEGYATLATGVLHKWTGWFAYAAALLNLAVAPSILGGTNINQDTDMTDLEAHVNASGRKELVKQVRAKIKELGRHIIFRTQAEPRGLGHAVYQVRDRIGAEVQSLDP
jgi:hypothetical protein